MIFRGPVRVVAGVSCALLAIVAIVRSVLWLGQTAAECESPRHSLALSEERAVCRGRDRFHCGVFQLSLD